MQQGMLWHSVSDHRAGVCIEQQVRELHAAWLGQHVRSAWQRVTDRHCGLRTSFNLEDPSGPSQEVVPKIAVPWEEQDWREAGADAAARRFEDYLREDRIRGLGLARPPVW